MATIRQVREVASVICATATGVCVQDDKPKRSPCTYANCRMMKIARDALHEAGIERK